MNNPIINVDNVHLVLKGPERDLSILNAICMRVKQGEKLSIMGPSGSGKTSLMLLLAGLEKATSGTIEIAGTAIDALSEDALAVFRRHHIGIVFQNFHLVPTMTALENVSIPLEFARQSESAQKAQAALETVGLSHRLHHFPSQLSGGEQQRVALARAFVMRPALLLADEPTGNLDQETGEQITQLMFELNRQYQTTLLLITHDAALAARCDRTLHLRDGKIVG